VNPLDVTTALAKGARQLGARIFEDTPAIRLVTRNGRIAGVETPAGTIATGKVLLAVGMWTARLAALHGVTVPLQAAEHIYLVTEPVPDLPRDLPALVVAEDRLYAKGDAGKLLLGGFEAQGKAWGTAGIPEDFEFTELPFDMEHSEPILAAMFVRFPALASMGIRTFFNGPESFTPDGRPYLGPAHELPGLYVAAGMNSNGILNSGGVGLTMAEWLIDGEPSRAMGSLLLSRAHPFQRNRRYLAERVTEAVGLHYGLHWPGRQIRTARGIRRLPLHDRLLSAGAVMSERIGWEVPAFFDPGGPGWAVPPSLGRQAWALRVRAECLAARDAAVLIDLSMYGKLIAQGPDAARALNRVASAQMDVPPGTSVYTPLLNARGGIEADVTVTRLSETAFLVVTGHPSQIRDAALLRSAANGLQAEVFDATPAYALLSLNGPSSRAILQALSSDDISNAAFPFGAAREIDVRHARAWAIRRSFTGELGYELLVPTEFAAHVHEAVLAAGAPHGLAHAGMFALNACRLEKAFRHFGHDIGEDDTPFEAGLGFAVDLTKHLPARLRDQAGKPLPHRLAAIRIEGATEDGPYLIHNEPVLKDSRIVGHVTSGGWGHRLQAMIGLAALHNPDGITADWFAQDGFTVRIAGADHPATLQLAPFHDPKGTIMRA
jgi:4-methylaminobutanoate oxidase (formaldehyde-forming)